VPVAYTLIASKKVRGKIEETAQSPAKPATTQDSGEPDALGHS
jgi:hypothetical protein